MNYLINLYHRGQAYYVLTALFIRCNWQSCFKILSQWIYIAHNVHVTLIKSGFLQIYFSERQMVFYQSCMNNKTGSCHYTLLHWYIDKMFVHSIYIRSRWQILLQILYNLGAIRFTCKYLYRARGTWLSILNNDLTRTWGMLCMSVWCRCHWFKM